MNTHPPVGTRGIAADTAAAAPRPASRRVVDAPTRMAHALIALSFLGAYLTAEGERWRSLHVNFGYVLAGVLLFRVVWGLVGPRQARVALWLRKLATAPQWLRAAAGALRNARPSAVPWRQGQNLLMAAVIAAIPLTLLPLLASGLAPHREWVHGGLADALSDLHGALGEALLALVLVHIGLIVALSLLRRHNQARPMLDGRLPGAGPDLARRNHGWLAALLLLAVVAFGAWQWQHAPQGLLPGSAPAPAAAPHPEGEDDD